MTYICFGLGPKPAYTNTPDISHKFIHSLLEKVNVVKILKKLAPELKKLKYLKIIANGLIQVDKIILK